MIDVLTKAGPLFDPNVKNDKLRHYVSVSAIDDYRALVAYGEIAPSFENKEVLLATSEDGRSLATDGPRLIAPGDISGGRYISNVNQVFRENSTAELSAELRQRSAPSSRRAVLALIPTVRIPYQSVRHLRAGLSVKISVASTALSRVRFCG